MWQTFNIINKQNPPGWFKFFERIYLANQSLVFVGVRVRIWGLEMFVFRKIWRALFFWNIRFEIRPFALLPTICPRLL